MKKKTRKIGKKRKGMATGGQLQPPERPTYQSTGDIDTSFGWDNTWQQALTGAISGASAASVIPGIGTAVGAVGGALIGGITGAVTDSEEQKVAMKQVDKINSYNRGLESNYDMRKNKYYQSTIDQATPSLYTAAKGGRIKGNKQGQDSIRRVSRFDNGIRGMVSPLNFEGRPTTKYMGQDIPNYGYPKEDTLLKHEAAIYSNPKVREEYRKAIRGTYGMYSPEYMDFVNKAHVFNMKPATKTKEFPKRTLDATIDRADKVIGGLAPSGLAKGGTIPNVSTNASTRRIGNAVEVTTNKKGTDKIKANVDGTPVMLDDNEIVIDYNGEPIVISDDLGEAKAYKRALKSGGNVDAINKVFAERAIKLQNDNKGNKLAGGGYVYNPVKNTYDYDAILNQSLAVNNNLPEIQNGALNTKGVRPNSLQRGAWNTGQLIKNNPDAIGSALSFAGTTANNLIAASKLKNTDYPRYQPAYAKQYNLDVNKPVFDEQKSRISREGRGLQRRMIEGTSNSNSAIQRANAIKSETINAMNPVFANQAADRAKWENANVGTANQFSMYNAGARNAYNSREYQDKVSRINTGLALGQSTIGSLDKVVEDYRRGKYDDETLRSIALSYGVTLEGTTPDEIMQSFITKLGQKMNIQAGK